MSLAQYQNIRRALLALLLMMAAAASSVFHGLASYHVEEWLNAAGAGLIMIGIVGRMWCTLYIGGRKGVDIVASGPYSISRNPLYVFSSIAAAGVGAQTGSVILAAGCMLVCAAAFSIVIRREERHLASLGPAYQRYCRTVPRFIPDFRLYQDDILVTVRPKLLYTTLADGLMFFAAIPLLKTFEYYQSTGVLPVILQLP